jgi:hypothetical protein
MNPNTRLKLASVGFAVFWILSMWWWNRPRSGRHHHSRDRRRRRGRALVFRNELVDETFRPATGLTTDGESKTSG